jgi:hypothetical protein
VILTSILVQSTPSIDNTAADAGRRGGDGAVDEGNGGIARVAAATDKLARAKPASPRTTSASAVGNTAVVDVRRGGDSTVLGDICRLAASTFGDEDMALTASASAVVCCCVIRS